MVLIGLLVSVGVDLDKVYDMTFVASWALTLGKMRGLKTTTLKAYTEEEEAKMLTKVP